MTPKQAKLLTISVFIMESSPKQDAQTSPAQTHSVHFPLLLSGIAIMLIGSIFPIVFTDAEGNVDHGIAMALFWAMSAALVRGVGFVPKHKVFRWLFSPLAFLIATATAAGLRFL